MRVLLFFCVILSATALHAKVIYTEEPVAQKQTYTSETYDGLFEDIANDKKKGIWAGRTSCTPCMVRRYSKGKLVDIDIIVPVTYYMPVWKTAAKATKKEQEKWQWNYNKLLEHEQGHGRIFREGYERLYNALVANKMREADSMFKTAEQRINVEQKKYDEVTHHGVKQENWKWQTEE